MKKKKIILRSAQFNASSEIKGYAVRAELICLQCDGRGVFAQVCTSFSTGGGCLFAMKEEP